MATYTIRKVDKVKIEESMRKGLKGYPGNWGNEDQEMERLIYEGITVTYYKKNGALRIQWEEG